jgi:hypothetical protein
MASGDAQNTLSKLAMETGEMGLLEIRDELAISLQMTDQYSYDNNFIYYQPGEFCPVCYRNFCYLGSFAKGPKTEFRPGVIVGIYSFLNLPPPFTLTLMRILTCVTYTGNGKVKVKEPMEMANKAIAQLGEAIEFAKSIR